MKNIFSVIIWMQNALNVYNKTDNLSKSQSKHGLLHRIKTESKLTEKDILSMGADLIGIPTNTVC